MKKAVFFKMFYCIHLVFEKRDQKGILCVPLQGEEQYGENRGKNSLTFQIFLLSYLRIPGM